MDGATPQKVRILPYDPAWPLLQAVEIEKLRQALGPCVVEPVGSAAIGGISGKPIIDLLIGVDPASQGKLHANLKQLGYRLGQPQSLEPGVSFMERICERDTPAVYLHIAPVGGRYWHDMVAFRDALRSDHALAKRYEDLKQQLADLHPMDLDAYAAGKSEFVRSVLEAVNDR